MTIQRHHGKRNLKFKGILEGDLHLLPNLWNDPDIKPGNVHCNSLEQDSKDKPEETENETIVIREVKELSEITKDCSLSSDKKESGALKIHQRRENSKQKNNEGISPSRSGIFQRKGSISTQPEDNNCNSVKKSTSEIGIHIGLTEEKNHMASGEHIATSCTEKSKSKRGVSRALPAGFVPMDDERSFLKSDNKEMILNRCVTAPRYDTKKQITVESLEKLTAEDESCLDLEIDYLRAQEKNMAQGSEKSMNGFSKDSYEKETQFRTDEDHNSKEKPEDISYELNDDMIHDGDKNVLESEQDTVVADDAVSIKTEEEYQTVYQHSVEEHSDNHNENFSLNCVLRRNYPRQMEHGEIKISQFDDEYMDLKRKPVRINSLEDDKMVGTDHASEKESKASNVVGEPSDSRIKQIDPCSLLENDVPQKVLLFPEVSLEKILQEERRPFEGENQNMGFKMKTCMHTEHLKKPYAWGSYQENHALLLKMFFGCIPILDRNMPKEDKFQDSEVHCKEDIKFHELALLKEIVSTWYFFPMLARFTEFCLPSSLQTFFERLISGPPISQAERMSYEWLRLESFNALPSSTRGTAARLAQSGFYYTRQGTRIRCYACNVEYEVWNNTDNPHELHQRISPNCPFLGGYPTYPNFPIMPDTMHDGNNTERSASSATPTIPVIQERTQSRVVETQSVIIPSINNSSTLSLDEISVPPFAVADVYLQVPSETVQVEARREKAETQGSSINWKQQQTSSNPGAGTSQPKTSPSSSSMVI